MESDSSSAPASGSSSVLHSPTSKGQQQLQNYGSLRNHPRSLQVYTLPSNLLVSKGVRAASEDVGIESTIPSGVVMGLPLAAGGNIAQRRLPGARQRTSTGGGARATSMSIRRESWRDFGQGIMGATPGSLPLHTPAAVHDIYVKPPSSAGDLSKPAPVRGFSVAQTLVQAPNGTADKGKGKELASNTNKRSTVLEEDGMEAWSQFELVTSPSALTSSAAATHEQTTRPPLSPSYFSIRKRRSILSHLNTSDQISPHNGSLSSSTASSPGRIIPHQLSQFNNETSSGTTSALDQFHRLAEDRSHTGNIGSVQEDDEEYQDEESNVGFHARLHSGISQVVGSPPPMSHSPETLSIAAPADWVDEDGNPQFRTSGRHSLAETFGAVGHEGAVTFGQSGSEEGEEEGTPRPHKIDLPPVPTKDEFWGFIGSENRLEDRYDTTDSGFTGKTSASFSSSLYRHAQPRQSQQPSRTNSSLETTVPPPATPLTSSASTNKPVPAKKWWQRPLTRAERDILKCSIAYLLTSLWTFNPTLNGLLPSPANAHTVATICVYYAPAKSIGSMLEADMFCLYMSVFSSFVCLVAVFTIRFIESVFHEGSWIRQWSDLLCVFVFLGGACCTLAWTKNRVNKPSFNTATSMAAITIFTVIVKEGGLRKLLETLEIILIGSITSNVVCFTLWPHSATSKLQSDISVTLESFSTLVTLLNRTFLLDEGVNPTQQSLSAAVQAHEKAFITLKKNLSEANSELLDPRLQQTKSSYLAVVESLTRLAQHITGLRGGTGLQLELLKAEKEGRIVVKGREKEDGTIDHFGERFQSPRMEKVEAAKANHSYFSIYGGKTLVPPPEGEEQEEEEVDEEAEKLASDANLFAEVRETIGPSMRHLNQTVTSTLLTIRSTFASTSGLPEADFGLLKDTLSSALSNFQRVSVASLKQLYNTNSVPGVKSGDDAGEPTEDTTKHAVFLVYYYIFTLEEFTAELISMLDSMREIQEEELEFNTGRKFWWAWRLVPCLRSRVRREVRKESKTLRKRMSKLMPIDPSDFQPKFPKTNKELPDTATNPHSRTLPNARSKFSRQIWKLGTHFRDPEIRYAVKVGLATAMLASLAFTEMLGSIFLEFRGEWSLIAFFATMSPTIGAVNFTSVHRVLGTLLGALVAAGAYLLFPDNNIILPLIGFFFSIPCFYLIVKMPDYAATGRFILLTFNLTALYSYNLRDNEAGDVKSVAWHRVVSVSAGVVWAGLVSRYWWPRKAREVLRINLAELWVDMSYIYSRIVGTFSAARIESDCLGSEFADMSFASERDRLLPPAFKNSLRSSVREFMAMELHLQISIIELRSLLKSAAQEPRMKGPFPQKLYNALLLSSQTLLDRLHSMRCVVSRREWDQIVYREFIQPVNAERRELVGNVLLFFSVLASSLKLKTPLPPYLPPAELARLRLLNKAQTLAAVMDSHSADTRHLLYFSYVLAMQGVTTELEYLGSSLQDAFGVQVDLQQFEDLFS